MSTTRHDVLMQGRATRPGAGLAVGLAQAAVLLLRLLALAVLLAPFALALAWLLG
jgi:tetrahydromethanopterin S-methyltransferase subunit F